MSSIRISELADMLGVRLDLELATVRKFARLLREHDLLSQRGRGRAAARATVLDCARLLVAHLATERPFLAVDACLDFGALVATLPDRLIDAGRPARPDLTLESLCGLPAEHNFEQALTAIHRGFGDEKFRAAVADVQCFSGIEVVPFALAA